MGAVCRGDPQCGAPGTLRSYWPPAQTSPACIAACLDPPLYATRFHEGFGTLYTAEYRPAEAA